MKESRVLEFKKDITNTFLKTVSAFANFGAGTILFGVDDCGKTVGVSDPDKVRLDIENRIQSMEELHREFESATEKGRAYRYRGKNPQKKSGKAGLAALLLVPLLLAGVGAFLFFGGKKDDAAVSVIGADAEEEWDEEDRSGTAGEQAAAKKADIPEGFTVEEHPILRSADSTYYNDCFVVENNSGKNVKAELISNAYDAEGNLVESKTGKLDPLGDKEKNYV